MENDFQLYQNCFGFIFLSADSAISKILFCLVSGFFALMIQQSIIFFIDLLRLWKNSRAFGLEESSSIKSSGMMSSSTLSKISQEPFSLAMAMQSNPAWNIRFSEVSFSIFCLLILDQVLFGFRLPKYCMEASSSSFFLRLSIQPKQSASSTASLQLTDGFPDFLLY